ncbi:MAG: asparagine synthase (glutamine-hydrolyzing), partial [Planctomycetota bacterium]|nr:asparagine synthase (glutamine-hydrolyzing) [Planctomycetota bacterium]
DTEVLLHGYRVWGWDSLLQRLNGMFALALYDKKSCVLYLARDRTGQKPLYYAQFGNKLLFGSEIKALLESELVSRDLNLPAIDRYLTLRYVPQPETLLRDIRVLPGGHALTWNDGRLTLQRYWQPPVAPVIKRSPAEALGEFTSLFDAAVSRTLRSDVPVGAYLSSGVDSSLLVATLAARGGSPFSGKTYALGFGSKIDETPWAAGLARRLGTDHTTIQMGARDFGELPRAIWHLERPIGEPLILAFDRLASTAAADGKVVISGEGADELFAGYSFHRVIRLVEKYQRTVPSAVHRLAVMPLLRTLPVGMLDRLFPFPAYLGTAGKQRFVQFMDKFARRDLGANYAALRSLFDVEDRQSLYAPAFRELATESWIHTKVDESARPLERLLNLQHHDWLQDFALLRQDKLSMAHGLEVRLPMLDHTLIDFAATLPENLKLTRRQNKVLLRTLAAQRLPRENAQRPKQAFYLPLESLYRHPTFEDLISETLNPASVEERGIFDVPAVAQLKARADRGEFLHLKQLMALAMLEVWMRIFLDKQRMW